MNDALALKQRLPITWSAFFGRHGSFTPIQLRAIPPLLDGKNVLLSAATASGKTEAALAPLIERYLPTVRPRDRLTLLYLLPTRALINDLAGRLAAPLDALRVRCAVKSRDGDSFDSKHPVDVLLTTPESLDSLFTTDPRCLIHVRALVIDELHIFDASVRGDQLRVLLARLRALQAYAIAQGERDPDPIQFAALSATLAEPRVSAARYFSDAAIVTVPGSRPIQADVIALDDDSPSALLAYLETFRGRGYKKALAFCNTRAEVEQYAAAVRAGRSPFGSAVFVHYSNLETERRHAIEAQFAAAEAALCFASSTLELGIDIGSIDIVLLIGAPGSADAFTQRIGRASRRQKTARAACFYRSPFERVLFEGLLHFSSTFAPPTPFRPSAAVQQIFSLLKQSPSGGIRLQPMLLHFDGLLNAAELESIFGELQAAGYLANGRPGEWRAGARLHRLVDMQGSEYAPLSLHSNIQSQGGTVAVRDQHTQRVIARLDRAMLDRNALVLEGRSLRIAWSDGDAVWIAGQGQAATQQRFRGRAARPVVSGGVARQIRAALTLPDDSAPYVEGESGWLWFHWLGDIHGRALLDLLGERLTLKASTQTALCVLLMEKPRELPLAFTSEQVLRYLHGHYRTYESLLALGAYHSLLPLGLRRRAVVDGFDVPAFLAAVAGLRVEAAPEATSTALWEIVELP